MPGTDTMQRDVKAFRRDRLSGQAEFTKQARANPDNLLRIFRRLQQSEKQEIQFRARLQSWKGKLLFEHLRTAD
jgi:hypothetical protein